MIKYALLLSLLACDDAKTDDTGDGPVGGTPTEGHWTTSATTTSDTCGFGDEGDTGGPDDAGMTVAMTDATTFTITFDDPSDENTEALTCHLNGQDFTCDTVTIENPIESLDATIIVTEDVAGTFPTWSTLTGNVALAVDCTGADCATVVEMSELTLPCAASMSLDGQAD